MNRFYKSFDLCSPYYDSIQSSCVDSASFYLLVYVVPFLTKNAFISFFSSSLKVNRFSICLHKKTSTSVPTIGTKGLVGLLQNTNL